MEEKRKTLSARLARWAAELVLVFIGVYAAFWLNSYQQHQQEAKRRDQILASLERWLREGIESGRINAVKEEQQAAEFQRALDADEERGTIPAAGNGPRLVCAGIPGKAD